MLHTREMSRIRSDLQRHGAYEVRSRSTPREPGWYWSATTGGHVICESRLELARLLLADFDPDVVAIAAQPFLLRAQAGGRVRRHVPDFLLIHAGRTVRVVNVKPAARLADPVAAEALAWPGELFEARGWGHEIWTGADRVFLANVRFLAGYRRPGMPPGAVIEVVLEALRPPARTAAGRHPRSGQAR
ncbi:MAG: TnsA-like heteromeric transposase endonuclease subunit [Gemmatimonadales bacterium]